MNTLDALYSVAAIAAAPVWARKSRGGWAERFGATPALPPTPVGRSGRLLIHAVSVGEVSALRHLVPMLTPEADVVVSVTTDTGLARAKELFGASCAVVRYPLDFSRSVRRFLDAVRPDAVALVELELWPNFIGECRRRGIPVSIINGRLSARSFRNYRRVRRWIGGSFAALEFAAVQDREYAARFEYMGVAPEACLITGSMKWDAARIEDSVAGAEHLGASLGIDRSRPLIVAGSTGPGEEALFHKACPAGVQLLCAPRKPERFDEAAAALSGCVRRSRTLDHATSEGPCGDRFLLDSIGELRQAYSLADVVVVGRSFGDLYGSDPIEPIALGKATVIGPAVSDFASIVSALSAAGGLVCTTRERLGNDLEALIVDPARRRGLAEAGRACIRRNQGASSRHAELLLELVSPRPAK
jgi:3-deoxy-D-manno-octulosonic-acid transferase